MSVEHSALTTTDLHEPKSIDAANSGDIYVADGAGSGAMKAGLNKAYVNVSIPDISTADSVWVVSPIAGTISKIYTVIDTTITTGNATITAEIGGTLVTDSSITIAFSGSVPGTVDSSTPSAANTVTAGGAVEVITDGGSTVASKATVTLEITKS